MMPNSDRCVSVGGGGGWEGGDFQHLKQKER